MTNKLEDWKVLYDTFFGIKIDTSNLELPKERDDFNQLIIVPEGLKIQRVYDVLSDLFPSWKYTDQDLDDIVTKNDREPTETYAICVRDRIEADEEFKNLSADDLGERGYAGITLLERLLLELFHFWKSEDHLDKENLTLCAGSRRSGGRVPGVDWCDGRLGIHWYGPSFEYSDIRSREVVTS